jgi:hypothetical protein
MKKTLLISSVALCLLAQAALAQSPYTFSISPFTQTVSGGTFQVTLSLTDSSNTAANNAFQFDLYIATAAANSGLFSITSAVGQGVWTAGGPGAVFPDTLNSTAGGNASFVINNSNMGFGATSAQTGPFTQPVEVINFSYTAAPGTYSFSTTTSLNAGTFFSDVSNSVGGVQEANPGTFSITVVPEPSTWAMSVLGVGVIGYAMLRRRRVA